MVIARDAFCLIAITLASPQPTITDAGIYIRHQTKRAARSVQLRATAFDYQWFRHLPYMNISSSGESPFVVAAHTCETSATYCVSTHTERVLLFRARDANLRIVNITRSSMEPERGDSKSKRLRKRKAVTPHRPAKRPRLFQADQQETELRQRRTFCKWRHNLAVYYAANLHGSYVNSAKST